MTRRALGAVRLTHLTDVTTSPGTQRALIESEAEREGLTLVDVVEDLNVGAADTPPAERPELGPWLTKPELRDQYDVVIWAKMDRAIRSVTDLYWLLGFCKRYNKELVFVKDRLDTSTTMGRIVATLLAAVGEIEIENMKERRQRSAAYLATTPRWPGGPPPYGYAVVDATGTKGKVLVPDPETSGVLREIVARVTAGEAMAGVARDLNERGIPTGRVRYKDSSAGGWTCQTMGRMLRSRAMLGQKETQSTGTGPRRLLLDSTGQPIQMAQPIVTMEEWQRLQAALDIASRPRPNGMHAGPLAGLLLCGVCGRPLAAHAPTARPPHTHKFRCHAPGRRCVSEYMTVVWTVLEDAFLRRFGDSPVMRRTYVSASTSTTELVDLNGRIDDLRAARYVRAEFRSPSDIATWDGMMAALLARRSELEAQPSTEAGWRYEPLGMTYRDEWARLDRAGRGDLIRRSGITARLLPIEGGGTHLELDVPADLVHRLSREDG